MGDDPAQARGVPQGVRELRRREVARFTKRDVERLLADPGIVRNRLKVESTVENAKRVLELDSLDEYLWGFVGGEPIVKRWRKLSDIPAETAESKAMSKDMKKRGFRFVGPTVCYAFMQAAGLVNDHVVGCYRFAETVTSDTEATRRRSVVTLL